MTIGTIAPDARQHVEPVDARKTRPMPRTILTFLSIELRAVMLNSRCADLPKASPFALRVPWFVPGSTTSPLHGTRRLPRV
jgi:hypothetical protein